MSAHGTRIRLVHCAKTFDDGTRALDPLDLEIAGAETIVLLGPSGCGKTTTLRIIAGLESPDGDGRVLFDDDDVTGLSIEKRNVGMVFQSYALFPNMNVAENVAYGLKIRHIATKQRQKRVDEMLEMMHITELAHRAIDQLSGGQKQRVALARAIAVEPRVLLLDEPLTALDARLRDELRVEIDGLLRRLGITSVYVTHDQAEAMALGDRIVVMSKGRVAQIGQPRDIYLRPATRFVADFIGTMNRLRGRAEDGHLVLPGGRLPFPGGNSAGGEVEVLFRPESADVVRREEAQLTGTVTASFFMGDRVRLIVENVSEAPLVVETTHDTDYQAGQPVHLRIDPAGLITLSR